MIRSEPVDLLDETPKAKPQSKTEHGTLKCDKNRLCKVRNRGKEDNGDENVDRSSDGEEPHKSCMSVYSLEN